MVDSSDFAGMLCRVVSVEDKLLSRVENWFGRVASSCTAFSGGVDSALVVFLSHRFLGSRASAAVADSPSLKRSDLEQAQVFCRQHGIRLHVLVPGELGDPGYSANPPNRCFFCKDHLYASLRRHPDLPAGCALLNGTNHDDFNDFRPGLRAADMHRIRSPLAECKIGKAEVRALAKYLGLPVWDKPASPCLSSRIPYGEEVTAEKLARIEAAEEILAGHGFAECRVRHASGDASIEVPVASIERIRGNGTILRAIRALGFDRVVVDEEGLVSGKLNRALGR